MKHTFTSAERLKSKRLINKLFSEGKVLNLYPIRVLYWIDTALSISHHQALFVVPKKRYKSAVARNQLRRRMREAHRLHKHMLVAPQSPTSYFLIGYMYVGDRSQGNFQTIQKKVSKALDHLKNLHK